MKNHCTAHLAIFLLLLGLHISGCVGAPLTLQPASQLPEVQAFIQSYHHTHPKPTTAHLQQLFDHTYLRPSILARMQHPAEHWPWYRYKHLFLTRDRIAKGVAFWHAHRTTLARAEQQYGVPTAIIVAILGVETYYGAHQADTPTLDALTTLAFRYPSRAHFFRQELIHFLELTEQQQLDPLHIRGSYAGAIGLPQFMPSSYLQYAVDFDHDGRADLSHSASDAIGSIGHYLQHFGWQPGQPIVTKLPLSAAQMRALSPFANETKALSTWAQLGLPHALDNRQLPSATPATLYALQQTAKQQQYWLTYPNFATLLHYNNSPLYALAVSQLAEQIKAHHHDPAKY